MKRALLSACLLLAPLRAPAACTYVRTSYKEFSCARLASDKEPASGVAASTPTLPGLEEAAVGPLDELRCTCAYVLEGSNPLCDSDREQEFSQTYPQDPAAPICSRAKTLCANLCPSQIH